MNIMKYLFLLTFALTSLYSQNTEIFNQVKIDNYSVKLVDSPVKQATSPTAAKYLLFNNFNLDASHPSFAQEAYIDAIKKEPEISPNFTYASFGTGFTEPITNYDVVVFPLGDVPLNVAANGVSILGELRKLIAAGKKIIITGRNTLTWAFNPQSQLATAEIQKFITDTLGMKYMPKVPVSVTNGTMTTYSQYVILGDGKDPISYGARVECNIKYKISTSEYEEPIAYYTAIDAFKTVDAAKYNPSYHFNSYSSDTLICTKTKIGDAKIVTWSVGFENFSLTGSRQFAMKYAISWLMEEAPSPGAQIEVADETIKFGNIKVGLTGEASISFKNTGSKDLVIKDLFIDWDDAGVFSFVNKPTLPFTLKNGEATSIPIKFAPKKNETYDAIITIVSNSDIGAEKIITLNGNGGSGSGPKFTTDLPNDELNFGQVVKGFKSSVTFQILNFGDSELNLQKIEFTQNDDKSFVIDQGSSYPYSIPVNGSRVMKIRFVALDIKKYNAKLEFTNDGLNANPFIIKMSGEGVTSSDVDENITNKFEFYPNPAKDFVSIKAESISSDVKISIYNAEGKLVHSIKDFKSNNNIVSMPVSDLNSGVYYLQIQENNKTQYLPLIIAK